MSETFGRIIGAADAIGSAFSAFGGPAILSLGDIEFTAFEVPERIRWGGGQNLACHDFPGGSRVVDAMGYQEAEISWSGTMLGPNVEDRAQQLDALRQDGDQVELIWSGLSRQVVVQSCEFDQGFQRIGYSIRCVVIPEELSSATEDGPTLVDILNGDTSGALDFDLSGALQTAQGALQTVQNVVVPLVGIVSPSAAVAIGTGLGVAAGAITTAQVVGGAAMEAVADAANIVDGIASLPNALSWSGLGAAAAAAGGYVTRGFQNVTGALFGGGDTVAVTGVSPNAAVVNVQQNGLAAAYEPTWGR